jgi:hypothetical protein
MDAKASPLLDLDFGDNGGRMLFYSFGEIESWANKENQFFSWVQQTFGADNQLQRLAQQMAQAFGGILSTLNNARPYLETPEWSGHLSTLRQQLSNAYIGGPLLASSTPKAQFVESLRVKDPLKAAYALGYLRRSPMQPIQASGFQGIFEAILYEENLLNRGVQEKAAAYATVLDELRKRWSDHFTSDRLQQDELQNRIAASRDEIEALHNSQKAAFDEFMQNSQTAQSMLNCTVF